MNSAETTQEHVISLHPEDTTLAANPVEEEILETSNEDFAWATPLIKEVESGNWDSFSSLLDGQQQSALSRKINKREETLLHCAIITGNVQFSKKVVGRMSKEDLEMKDNRGNTAFMFAVSFGMMEIVESMLGKNDNLACIRGVDDFLPVVLAATLGNKSMVRYLYKETPKEELSRDTSKNRARLLTESIISDMYDVALELLKSDKKLAFTDDGENRYAIIQLAKRPHAFPSGHEHGFLSVTLSISSRTIYVFDPDHTTAYFVNTVAWLGIKRLQHMNPMHGQVLEVLKVIREGVSLITDTQGQEYEIVCNSAIIASQFGIVEIVDELLKCRPGILFAKFENLRGIFASAIMHRQEKVFNLLYEMRNKESIIADSQDAFCNNMLHQAAFLPPSTRINKISGAALQMQYELQWFKELEKFVPRRYKEEVNNDFKTPQALFTEQHEALVQKGEKWMKETATACMVVSTLIATVMFTAAFTVPGGTNSDTGFPVFIKHKLFIFFMVSDALSLFSSCTSLLMFLGILTSRYAEQDFLLSLPRKLILGLTALFFSIVFMMAAFCATLFIILRDDSLWVPILSTSLAISGPVVLFLMLQIRLLKDMISSYYAPNIFLNEAVQHSGSCSLLKVKDGDKEMETLEMFKEHDEEVMNEVNSAEQTSTTDEEIPIEDYKWAVPLIRLIERGEWRSFKSLLDCHPGAHARQINSQKETFLHYAVIIGEVHLAKHLLELMSPEDVELKDENEDTAFAIVAESDMMQIARMMVGKNENLLCIRGRFNLLPVVKAACEGNQVMVKYLYKITPKEELGPETSPETSQNGARLISESIVSEMYDIALDLLQKYPKLAIALDDLGRNSVSMLATRPLAFPSGFRHGLLQRTVHTFHQKYILRTQCMSEVLEILKIIGSQLAVLDQPQLKEANAYSAMTNASQFGIVEFVDELIKSNLDLLYSVDGNMRGVFPHAILYRQEKVFNLIYEMKNKKTLIRTARDTADNNLLHLAGFITPSSRTNKLSGVALQIQRELQWFDEVERLVPPRYLRERNNEGYTPKDLFTKEHVDMVKEAEKWMKETAQACMLVATLIATMVFTAAFTVPGGVDSNTGKPVFIRKTIFMVFIVTDALSFFSSCSSIVMFLAILTSRYAERDFLLSLPRKMIIGLTTLFFSIDSMMAAFSAALFILLPDSKSIWVAILCSLLGGIPVSLFVMLQFPLLVDMFISTYGPTIFVKKSNRILSYLNRYI
ncbi:hypothetical protein IFM89_001640 [Coptis chinensis]|uniref:PGG domain-containing protein n=1 Tax=Coptis chinensis TaxID=261450 RepID=A0A835LQC3_9MAGN|nr:hypothetical protein IFM89_001640 [Coptis chinensis]